MSDEGTYYNGEFPEVGDVIECLPENGSFPKLRECEQYTVEEIDGGYVFFEGDGWWPSRFCLITRGADFGANEMHYRNGREAKNGDKVVSFGNSGGCAVEATGILVNAVPGNDHCNGQIVTIHGWNNGTATVTGACLCDCLHADDLKAILAEKGLDKRPAGK